MQAKRSVILILIALGTALLGSQTAARVGPAPKLKLNGEAFALTHPLLWEKGRILVALEDLLDLLELKARREDGGLKVFLQDQNTVLEFTLNQAAALLSDKKAPGVAPRRVVLEVGPRIFQGTVYLPLRFAAESFAAAVLWQSEDFSVAILTKDFLRGEETQVEYTILKPTALAEIAELRAWYEENRQNPGIHSLELDEDTYVLLSAGMKPTGGFGIEIAKAFLVDPANLYIAAELIKPGPTDFVTMALTYPHLLLKFPQQTFATIQGELREGDH